MMAPPANRPAQCRQPDTKRGNSTVSFGFNRKRYCLWHSSQAESQEMMLDHADEIVAPRWCFAWQPAIPCSLPKKTKNQR